MREIFSKALIIFIILSANCFSEASQSVWPAPPEQPRIKFLYSFSKPEDLKIAEKGSEKFLGFIFGGLDRGGRILGRPQGIAVRNGVIAVTDTLFKCVHVFDEINKEYFKINRIGDDPLSLPVGAAIGPDGKIYISDSNLNRVMVFNKKGEYSGDIGRGSFKRPTGIVIDGSLGRVYVVDTLDGSVNAYDPDGKFLLKFGSGMNHPTYISVSKTSDVYVADSLNFKVLIYSKDGKQKGSFGRMGREPGSFSMPKGIALDGDSNIYVSDSSFDNIQIFSSENKLLLFFGEPGSDAGEFWLPAGISIGSEDKVYVADSYNGRVQVFQYIK